MVISNTSAVELSIHAVSPGLILEASTNVGLNSGGSGTMAIAAGGAAAVNAGGVAWAVAASFGAGVLDALSVLAAGKDTAAVL